MATDVPHQPNDILLMLVLDSIQLAAVHKVQKSIHKLPTIEVQKSIVPLAQKEDTQCKRRMMHVGCCSQFSVVGITVLLLLLFSSLLQSASRDDERENLCCPEFEKGGILWSGWMPHPNKHPAQHLLCLVLQQALMSPFVETTHDDDVDGERPYVVLNRETRFKRLSVDR